MHRQTKLEEDTRNYLSTKLQHLSPLKRKADAAATTVIPLTTTHGGRPMHVQILPCASSKPLEGLTAKQKRRRTLSAELHQAIVQAPPPPIPPPLPLKLSPRETMTFAQLSGQQTHRALRAMRSFLAAKGINFLCTDHALRAAEQELHLPLHVESTHPVAFRLTDLTAPLTLMLTALHAKGQLAAHREDRATLSLQLQLDKGAELTKGLLKVINVQGHVHQTNILPVFHYVGEENYARIAALQKPLLQQLEDYALPPALTQHFTFTLKVLSADTKALQTTLGLSESSSSAYPCPFCLIPSAELRSPAGVTSEYPLRNSLQHGVDHLELRAERGGDPSFAKEHHSCKQPPPFMYGLPGMKRNIVIALPVLHISIGLATKLLKLVRSLAPNATAFTQLLADRRLSFYNHHGETLLGPQVHRLLSEEPPLYLQVLGAVREVRTRDTFLRAGKIIVTQTIHYPRLLELFQLFAACYKLYTADRFLSPAEIPSLTELCRSFGAKFVEYYRWESVTPKLHMLAVEIPRFARMHRTVGLYSEQAIESMHAEVNRLMRDYAGMGDTLDKHKLVFQALCRKHCPAIPAFDPPRRLCSVCEEPLAHNKDIHTACQLIKRHK